MLIRRPQAKTPKGKVTAKTESKKVVGLNEARAQVVISNKGEKDVYLAYGPTAAKEEGITLFSKTSIIEEHYTGEITCYAHEGEQLVTFIEV